MNFRTIPRYGPRSVPGDEKALIDTFRRGEAVEGPAIREFETRFADFHGMKHAVATSFGRMAFYHTLRALDLEPGSEIIFPALTFWVVPEIARQVGLRPVFVDIDPATFNIDPWKIQAAITEKTRAIVPTHLYGRPCDMDDVMAIAEANDLIVIEDCAQAAGARYHGQRVGTFGRASFFSFQMLKGINTYGGGMVVTNDDAIAESVRKQIEAYSAQTSGELVKRFAIGVTARGVLSPQGFTFWGYPIQALASLFGHFDISRFVWEDIRPLDPLPRTYTQRYSNAQAVLGLRALEALDEHNQRTRRHAHSMSENLRDSPSIQVPSEAPNTEHVYYQYSIYASDPATLSRRAIRRGVDFETTHVDVCSSMPIFAEFAARCPFAEATEQALQLPVYSRLRDSDSERVLEIVKKVSAELPPLTQTSVAARRQEPATKATAA